MCRPVRRAATRCARSADCLGQRED